MNASNQRISHQAAHSKFGRNSICTTTKVILYSILLSGSSFYAGLFLGMHHSFQNLPYSDLDGKRVQRFPDSMNTLFQGMARVNRDEFAKRLDIGIPLDQTKEGNQDVLLLYSPMAGANASRYQQYFQGNDIPLLPVEDATLNCDTVKIILTEPQKTRQCLAIMGQWESYHVHKFMRLPPDEIRTGINHNLPLRSVSRMHSSNKGMTQYAPRPLAVQRYDSMLVEYLQGLKSVLAKLSPIASKVAKNNTIVVLVCNHGQSELLVNFICTNKARGLDLGQVLVFATDTKTRDLVEGLGVTAFYDEKTFEKMPDQAARRYGDLRFQGMMLAKVFCVHMISQLGYNLLFQDVDVVWYRNPVEYFLDKENPLYDFDMYFQDDGAHSVRYAPFSPNTGFYFVRHNTRTQYFFSNFVRTADQIMQSGSHQSALSAALNEHVSYRGLRVKIFPRDEDEFPGGYHFHRGKMYMKDMLQGRRKPYVFHMSWTLNKENKRKFFQQIGDWYVQDKCIEGSIETIFAEGEVGDLTTTCCSAEPLLKCHFRDKPSKIPCRKSPMMDKGRRSFW